MKKSVGSTLSARSQMSSKKDCRTESKKEPSEKSKSRKKEKERKEKKIPEFPCSECANPPEIPPVAGNGVARTTLHLSKRGEIPVLQGDPKWLPPAVAQFVCEQADIMNPSAIWICNGSVFEADYLRDVLVGQGVMEKLMAYDNVYLARTDPADVARVEKQTYISTKKKSEVEANRGSTTECELARFMSRSQLADEMNSRFPGCMRGRTMYVIPFSMGPIAGPVSLNAVQLTDSPYVVINMRIVSRVSSSVWDSIGEGKFVRCVHSVGAPRPVFRNLKKSWVCNTDRVLVAHLFPELKVFSYGSGYGGNSLLGKKCLALRIGSYLGQKNGWLAEHAALVSLTDPNGKEIFVCVSMPSGVGKTVLATMMPSLPGWKVHVLGDDITWLRFNKDGELCAMAPENGMFGIAADVKPESGRNIINMISKDALLVNAASTSKGRFMWSGLESTLAKDETVLDWKGQPWAPESKALPSHPNCRFTAYTTACPNVHPHWDGEPVPIAAYIWGTKRPDAMPLVLESNSWQDGVVQAATMRTQVGSVSDKKTNALVHDPMSMRPFMAYNFARYVQHWLTMGSKKERKLPKLFHVNWYQTDADGKPIWPGYGENIRVLEWIFNRVTNPEKTEIVKTPVGILPKTLNFDGLKVEVANLLKFDKEFWRKEINEMSALTIREMGDERPKAVADVLSEMKKGIAM